MNPAALMSAGGDAMSGAAALIPAVFGSTTTGGGSSSTTGTSTTTGSTREKLNISDEAVKKIIADVLGGAGGLAEIFAGEQSAGLYNASSSAQAAGDLAAKLVGEIAALTAEKETSQEQTTDQSQDSDSSTKSNKGGLFGGSGFLGLGF